MATNKTFSIPNNDNINQLNTINYVKDNFFNWRTCQSESIEPYYLLNTEFKKYLPYLTTGALKLYLHYCFSARNDTGESWYGRDSIAKELNTTTRSIDEWNSQLIDLNLIYRGSNNKSSTSTFILPISDYFLKIDDLNIEEYCETTNPSMDGNLVGCIHLFQWRKQTILRNNNKESVYDKPYHLLVLIFEKKINNIIRKKFIVFSDDSIDNYNSSLSAKKFQDITYKFESPFENDYLKSKEIKIQGFAINPSFNLDEPGDKKQVFFNVLKECAAKFNTIKTNTSVTEVTLEKGTV